MSGPLFDKIALIGIGLIGGSIALEARKRGLANKIVAATRKAETADLAADFAAHRNILQIRIGR